jgi:hypothetical protein
MIEMSPVVSALVGLGAVIILAGSAMLVELWFSRERVKIRVSDLEDTLDIYRHNTKLAVEAYDAGDAEKLAEFIEAHRRGTKPPADAPVWIARRSPRPPRPRGTPFVLIRGGRRGGGGEAA